MTLGHLIDKLQYATQNKKLILDFNNQCPLDLDSWRGVYANLAIGYNKFIQTRVDEFVLECKSTVGKLLYGYNGGEYIMTEDTPVFVDNWGECSMTVEPTTKFRALINVIENEDHVLLVTEYIGY